MIETDKVNYYADFGNKVLKYLWWTGVKKVKDSIYSRFETWRFDRFAQKIQTGLVNIDTLHRMLGEDPSEPFSADDSELNPIYYDDKESYFQTLIKIAVDRTPLRNEDTITRLPSENVNSFDPTPNESWFFLNGVCTSADMAKVNARMLSKVFGRPIAPLHNPTNGMMSDLIECLKGRTFDFITDISETTKELIWDELQKIETWTAGSTAAIKHSHKVVVIAHSQGGIIISNAVGRLLKEHPGDPLLEHLEIYTFASAHDDYPSPWVPDHQHSVPFTEHFANDCDYTARNGVLSHVSRTAGHIYVKKGSGHLLNYHYLRDFMLDKYEGPVPSRLSTLRNGNR